MYVDTNHLQYVYLYTTLNNKIGCCNLLFTFYDESATYVLISYLRTMTNRHQPSNQAQTTFIKLLHPISFSLARAQI